MPQHQTAEYVSQPVKKRGRFANLSARREDNLPTHQRNVPAGFVRDLLDDEDSEDDPDFDGDVEISDEDEDAVDDLVEPELALDDQDASEDIQRPTSSSGPQPQSNAPLSTHDDQDPEFEVDSLDSTDDEGDEEHFQNELHAKDSQGGPSDGAGRHPEFINFGDVELNSDDEDDDPDFEANIEQADILQGGDIYDEDGEPAQSDALDDEYIQFLTSLLADNGEQPQSQVAPLARADEGPTDPSGQPSDGHLNIAGDDDDDFDYLRASAMIQDDPLEYRDDLHVSRKEVAQLLFSSNESTLRRQTRTLRAKKAPIQPGRRLREGEQKALPASLSIPSVLPGPAPPVQPFPAAGVGLLQGPSQIPTNNYLTVIPQPLLPPHHASFLSLTPVQMLKFNEQFGVYIQILTHVHAVCKKKLRGKTEGEPSHAAEEDFSAQSDPKWASEKSEHLLKRVLQNHRVSTSYHELMKAHITKMKAFSEGLLHEKGKPLFSYETSRTTAYGKPVISLIEPFLRECETADLGRLPASALQPFEPYGRKDVEQSLMCRPHQRQYTVSSARQGWFAWSTADDNLLAMTIAKYGRECGDYAKDLLPHRLEEDCQARVRYLASRRCKDNPVKRQVLHISAPLNRDELRLVEIGLQQFGGKIDDPDVWKQIQRQLLPTREWSHLQKLWLWRETRRKYKATYRAKASKKKALSQGTVVV